MSEPWELDAAALRAARPRHILFLCVRNSARSQLAEGIARALAPPGVKISSAGSDPSAIHPLALAALGEIDVDGSRQTSKHVSAIPPDEVDAVITLCADEVCPVYLGKARRIHWAMPDPAAVTGTDEECFQAFRQVRDELRKRLAVVFAR